MEIHPIAHFRSPLTSKFGIPRQSGLVSQLAGSIVFDPPYRQMEAVRGLEDFDFLWILWEFSANRHAAEGLTVRPPRLGGNRRMGVFATRSPFRPNGLGLSCVRIESICQDSELGPIIKVRGADLMDGTPIYDIKPYVTYTDSHPDARSGFVDRTEWQKLTVHIPDSIGSLFDTDELESLRQLLALDPRPRYHDDGQRIYGMPFAGRDVRFRVDGSDLYVTDAGAVRKKI